MTRSGIGWILATALVLFASGEATARRARIYPPTVHCTTAGQSPKKIARMYGVRVKDLARGSGAVQRLQAENRQIRNGNKRRKALAKRRLKMARRNWKKNKRRGKRPKLRFTAKKMKVFGEHVAVRVVRPRKFIERRDAVLRLQRGASVKWVAKTFGISQSLVRCVNTLKKRTIGVGCRRKRLPGKRRGLPRYRYTCDGGHKWLTVRLPKPKSKARSTGSPNGGRLRRGELFPRIPGLIAKQKQLTYASNHMVTRIIDAVGMVNKQFAETPDLVLGDISKKGGGRLKPHKSHQNGLDADIGYYHIGKTRTDRFTVATAKNFDRRRTWALVKRLLESGEVQYIFMSTSVQKLLRAYVLKRRRADGAWCLRFLRVLADRRYGKTSRRRGRGAAGWERCVLRAFSLRGHSRALIRHAKGHDNHLHVRLFPRGKRARRGGAP